MPPVRSFIHSLWGLRSRVKCGVSHRGFRRGGLTAISSHAQTLAPFYVPNLFTRNTEHFVLSCTRKLTLSGDIGRQGFSASEQSGRALGRFCCMGRRGQDSQRRRETAEHDGGGTPEVGKQEPERSIR